MSGSVNGSKVRTARASPVTVAWRCFLEARPSVQLIFLLRLLSGWALTVTGTATVTATGTAATPVRPLVTGGAAWFGVVTAVYLRNGASDVREDRVNAGRRPIARGLLPPAVAARVAWVLAGFGVVAGFATAPLLGLLALGFVAAGWLYSVPPWRLKRRSTGVAVTVLVGLALTYYAGSVIATAPPSPGWHVPPVGGELLVFGGALTLWAALVGGTTKDLPDLAGDRAAGTRSWLAVWGERRFRYAVSAIALAIGAGFVAAAGQLAPRLLPPAAALFLGAVTVAMLLLTPLSSGSARAGRRRPYRAFMVTQYVAHLALAATVVQGVW